MFQYPYSDTYRENCHCVPPASNAMDTPLWALPAEPEHIREIYSELYREEIYSLSMNGSRTAAPALYLRYIQIINAVETAKAAGAGKSIVYASSRTTTTNVSSIPMAKRYSIENLNCTVMTIPAGYFQA